MNSSSGTIVGIVYLSYFSSAILCRSIEELMKQNIFSIAKVLVYVVDNSGDMIEFQNLSKTIGLFTDRLDVTMLFSSDNLGYSKGNNLGLEYAIKAGCDHVCVMNPDAYFADSTSLSVLLRESVKYQVSVIGPSIQNENGLLTMQNPISKPRPWIDLMLYLPMLAFGYSGFYNAITIRTESRSVFSLCGCCLFAPAHVWLSLGLIPEDNFMYYEEWIMGKRAADKGLGMIYAPQAVICHAQNKRYLAFRTYLRQISIKAVSATTAIGVIRPFCLLEKRAYLLAYFFVSFIVWFLRNSLALSARSKSVLFAILCKGCSSSNTE